MTNTVPLFGCTTAEDLSFEMSFTGMPSDLSGRTFSMAITDRPGGAVKATLTIGSGLSLKSGDNNTLQVYLAKATMASWPTNIDYTADLIETTGGKAIRILPIRLAFYEPGRMYDGQILRRAEISWQAAKAIVAAMTGPVGPVGLPNTLSKGTTTDVPYGTPADFSITGTAPNQTLNLVLQRGPDGAGAPTSPDILAIARRDDLLRAINNAGVPDEPSLILDFVRGTHWVRNVALAASLPAIITALAGGSAFTRTTVGSYFDNAGVLRSAAAAVPRIECDPITRAVRGLLFEASGQNSVLYSEDFAQATWVKGGTTVVAGASVAPDGATTMSRLVESAGSTTHTLQQAGVSVTSGTTYTWSVFAREPAGNANKRYLFLLLPSGMFAANIRVTVDLATGAVIGSNSPVAFGATPCGNGIWRVYITATAVATGTTIAYCGMSDVTPNNLASYAGDGTSAIEIWGAMYGPRSTPMSYIKTGASIASRDMDGLSLVAPAILQQSEGTLLAEIEMISRGGLDYLDWQATDASANNDRIISRRVGSGISRIYAFKNGAALTGINPLEYSSDGLTTARLAARYKSAAYGGAANGAAVVSNAQIDLPNTLMTRLTLSAGTGSSGYVRRLMYYPAGLSDLKLQKLSDRTLWS